MKKVTLSIRADGGHATGFGHLSRCVSLARAVRALEPSVKIIFWCRDFAPARSFLSMEGFEFETIETPEDEDVTAARIMESGSDLLVLDIAEHVPDGAFSGWTLIERSYSDRLSACAAKTVQLDDFAIGDFRADMVVNGGVVEEYTRYSGSVAGCLLVGPAYTLMRPDFERPEGEARRKISDSLEKLLIVDCGHDFTPHIHDAVRAVELSGARPEILLVSASKATEDIAERFDLKIERIPQIKRIAEAMRAADAVIAGGGTILYELAATGTPAISIPAVDHQYVISEKFERLGSLINAGPSPAAEKLNDAALRLRDPAARRKMSSAGMAIVDGRGARRVAEKILEMISGRTI